jgi:hypothetical protein
MSLRLPFGLAVIAAVATLGARTTRATLLVRSTVAERAARGGAVIVGRIESTRVVWDGKRIVTHSSVATERAIAGTAAPLIEVVTPGGTIDGIGMRVIGGPDLRDGSRSVLFLSHADPRDGAYRVLDLQAGALEIERGADGVDRVRDERGRLRDISEIAEELVR